MGNDDESFSWTPEKRRLPIPYISVASDIHSHRQRGKSTTEYLKPKLAIIA